MAGDAVLLSRFALGSRLLFVLRQTGRLAVCSVPVPPGRDRHSCVLDASVRLSALVGSLRVCAFFMAISTGLPGTRGMRGTRDGGRGWRRGFCALSRGHIGTVSFSAGSTLGLNVEAALRPPQTAPKSRMWKRHSRLSGLFSGAGRAAECALRGACRRFTPAVCLATNRTACGMLRFYSAGSRSPFVRSRDVGAVICLCGFTSGWLFVCSDLDGVAGDAGERSYAGNGAGGAALLRFCATALAL